MDRSPGGQCTICNHPQRVEIDKALVEGESLRNVAKRFDVSYSSVGRHKRNGHIAEQIAKAARKKEIKQAREIIKAVHLLGELDIVGFDLVEVSPLYDPSERTALLAAKLIREAIMSFGRAKS